MSQSPRSLLRVVIFGLGCIAMSECASSRDPFDEAVGHPSTLGFNWGAPPTDLHLVWLPRTFDLAAANYSVDGLNRVRDPSVSLDMKDDRGAKGKELFEITARAISRRLGAEPNY